mgnify:FL=1
MFNKKNYKISLDKFIEKALYHPTKGYYMKNIPFGKDGDFITAPNISIIFSEMIFIWIISYWKKFYKNKKINIVELGAGNAEMMYQIINSAKKFDYFFKNCDFCIYEKSKKLINLQKLKLKKYNVKWVKSLDKLQNKPTIFLGNEFLDALPVKQFIKANGNWYERFIYKKNGHLSFSNIRCKIDKIQKKLKFKISKKTNFLEISLDQINYIKQLNNFISHKGGCILFIDYAYLGHTMYDTLQAVKKHRKINILEEVGNADITHIINIPFLKKIAKTLNLELDYNTQREFLLNLGILKRAEILASKKSFLEKANIYYRINRLIDKKQMGEIFKVIYFYKKKEKFKLGFK